uniref:Uncharacterized protein n=1 Tax=Oryza meridionalis TaxID=40149 RepID=A0A0E0DXJ7_9ORYZ
MKEARLRVLPSCQETLEGPISQDQSGPSDLLRLSFLLRSGHRRDTAHVLPAGAPLLHLLPTRGRGIPVPSTPAPPLHLRACTSSSSEVGSPFHVFLRRTPPNHRQVEHHGSSGGPRLTRCLAAKGQKYLLET